MKNSCQEPVTIRLRAIPDQQRQPEGALWGLRESPPADSWCAS